MVCCSHFAMYIFLCGLKMASNIDILQGIVSKLDIPVLWQHSSLRVLIGMVFLMMQRAKTCMNVTAEQHTADETIKCNEGQK